MISIPKFEIKNQIKAHAIRIYGGKDMHHKFKWIGPEGYSAQNPGDGSMYKMSKLTNSYSTEEWGAAFTKIWEQKGWIEWLP
jgi:hypothetical protein